jgi:glycogen operon protein
MNEVDERGEPIKGDTLLLLINAHWETIDFTLPSTKAEHSWQTMVDTLDPEAPPRVMKGGEKYPLHGRSLALLRTVLPEEAGSHVSAVQVELLRKGAKRSSRSTRRETPLA